MRVRPPRCDSWSEIRVRGRQRLAIIQTVSSSGLARQRDSEEGRNHGDHGGHVEKPGDGDPGLWKQADQADK